jgi:MoaA/NifB/PqqE/SkfB family radical SAM enzyme
VHELIASPFLDHHLVLRPGAKNGLKIPHPRYQELEQAATTTHEVCPAWLADPVRQAFGLDLTGRPVNGTVLVRPPSSCGFVRASYELNLGCNYDCEHCYLGLKKFEGLSWPDRQRLLLIMRDAGVLWLQLTGGEPLIDPLFPDVYRLAYELGMMLTISSNGSRLYKPAILDLFAACPPYRVVLSVYGATEESYDSLTRRRGSFKAFTQGLTAGVEAGLPLRLNLVVTDHTAGEVDAMIAMADQFGLPYHVYSNISPTIYGGPESLSSQAVEHLRSRKPFTGCNAGITHFHADPHGMASICKVGRDQQIPVMNEGVEGLARLGAIADSLMLRTGGCSGCGLSGSCGTCRPLAKLYQQANAPLNSYCQHGGR